MCNCVLAGCDRVPIHCYTITIRKNAPENAKKCSRCFLAFIIWRTVELLLRGQEREKLITMKGTVSGCIFTSLACRRIGHIMLDFIYYTLSCLIHFFVYQRTTLCYSVRIFWLWNRFRSSGSMQIRSTCQDPMSTQPNLWRSCSHLST